MIVRHQESKRPSLLLVTGLLTMTTSNNQCAQWKRKQDEDSLHAINKVWSNLIPLDISPQHRTTSSIIGINRKKLLPFVDASP